MPISSCRLGYKSHRSVCARIAVSILFCISALGAFAPRADSQQRIEDNEFFKRVFQQHEFSARPFGPARWLEDGKAYTTVERSPASRDARDIVRYDTASGQREVLISATDLVPSGAKQPLELQDYEWSSDMNRLLVYTNSQRVWRQNTRGDYWVFDRKAKTLRKLGGDAEASTLMFATFSPDGSRVAYVHKNNLYVEDLSSGAITQLTHDGSDTVINGTSDWVYEEELDVRNAYRWSPDGKRIAYWQFNTSTVRSYALIYDVGAPYEVVTHIPYPQFGIYPYVKQIPYPQPGTPNSSVRIGVVPASGGETKWMDVVGDPEKSYIARMEWAGDSNTLEIQHLNRRQDNVDMLLADATTGATTTIHREHDPAWVEVVNDVQWLHGGKDFLWSSEKDSWRHLYMISRDGKEERLVTRGSFDVVQLLRVDPEEQYVYYIASPDDATQRFLYRSKLDGSGPELVTSKSEPGVHNYDISPDFHWAFHTYSTIDNPPITELIRFSDQQVARPLQNNADLRAHMRELVASPTEYLKLDIGSVTLDAWMIKPKNFDASKKYPILVFVYGEPAGQTVEDHWGGEQGVWFRYLANQGYIIASFDNHGTPAPRGREWRKIVYGSVGVLSSKEQLAALQKLEQTHLFIDSSRVGVWGWSGGGSNTLNLMFRSPEVYKVGMSVAPVADQRFYDSIYQERYMGLPQQNAGGYEASSAINFAAGLRGNLLIVHSPDDDNVHFQGTELLINRLVELGKQFDFMDYPGRTHSLSEGPNTHYHLYCLLTRYLEDHLPPTR